MRAGGVWTGCRAGSHRQYEARGPASSQRMNHPDRFFTIWRSVSLAGTRDVWDGVVRPEHQGPSDELARFLREWPGAWYWSDDAHTGLVLIRGSAPARPERWLWHGALLALFIICTLGAGASVAGVMRPAMHPGLGGAV